MRSFASDKHFLSKWMIALSFAPDINSVGLQNDKSVSPKIGWQLYYVATLNWWVSGGIFYSNKKYKTNAEGYKPPKEYWI